MKYQDSTYNIVYATDDSFVSTMGVSIDSLLKNNKNAKKINLIVLNTDISKKNIEKLFRIVNKYENGSLKLIDAVNIEKKLSLNVEQDRGSVSQYARLFLNDIFDKKINRILYLDCDTLIDGSIYDLWNTDLHGKIIGALKDAFSKYYRKNIGLNKNDIMFNSGVMLIDLEKWRNSNIEQKLMNFIIQHKGIVQQGDQGVLNAILSKEVYPLNPQYNFVSIFSDYTYEQILLYRHPVKFYSKKQIEQAAVKPIIIHFTSSIFTNRPWEEDCKNLYLTKWLEYKSETPWKNEPLRKDGRGPIKKSIKLIFGLLPISLSLYVSSIFQAYLRPIKNSLRGI